MKRGFRAVLLQAMAMIMVASTAQAHRATQAEIDAVYAVDPNDPALDYLRANGMEAEAAGLAQYCQELRMPINVCVQRLGGDPVSSKAAADCAKQFGPSPSFDPTIADMQKKGTDDAGKPLARFHTEVICSSDPEFKCHSHWYSEADKVLAGRWMGNKWVEELKQNYEHLSSTTSKEASAAEEKSAGGEASGGLLESAVKFIFGEKKTNGESYKDSESQKGPSKAEIDKAFEEGKKFGYDNPTETPIVPEGLNKYGDKPPAKDQTSSGCSCSCSSQPPDLSQPTSKNPDPSNPPNKDVDVGSTISPLEQCQAEKYRSWLQQGYHYSQSEDGDTRTRREKAEEALSHGACDPSWYGAQFCKDFNAKKSTITTNPADQPAMVPQKTAAEKKAEKDALATDLSQPDSSSGATLGFDTLCSDPKTSAKTKALMGCSGQTSSGTGEDLWCSDPRATDEEKTALGCFGYGKTSLPDPYAPPSTDDASSDPVPAY